MSQAVRRDLRWWSDELRNPDHRGVPLAGAGAGPVSYVYADVSGKIGWMVWTLADGELLYVVGEWTAEERDRAAYYLKEGTAGFYVGIGGARPVAAAHGGAVLYRQHGGNVRCGR